MASKPTNTAEADHLLTDGQGEKRRGESDLAMQRLGAETFEFHEAERLPLWEGVGWGAVVVFSVAIWIGIYLLLR